MDFQSSNNKTWLACAAISIGLWSSVAYLGTRLANVPPFLLLGVALLVGSLPAISHFKKWFSNLRILALGVGAIFGYHFLLFMALRLAPPVEANLINYLWPILIVLLSPLFFKELPLRLNHLIGGLIAFLGAATVVSGGKFHFESTFWVGYVLAFAAAVIWALYSLISKKLSPFPTAMVGGFCFFSGLFALVIHQFFEAPTSLPSSDCINLIFLGLGPMGIAFYTWDKALKEGDPRVVGGISYLTPLFSSLILMTLGHREISLPVFFAMGLIITGAIAGAFNGVTRVIKK
jgi:drug/metabolite transporter (DMT)-like permease